MAPAKAEKPAPPRTLAVAPVNRIVPLPARSHDARGLAARQEAGESGHLPDLGIDLRRRLDDGKAHVGADVEDEDLDRPDRPLDRLDEGRDVGLVARVEPEGVRLAAVGADALGERLQRLRHGAGAA